MPANHRSRPLFSCRRGAASFWLAGALMLGACLGLPPSVAADAAPVRDWRDEILYFAMIDRFDDGNPGNNDQGAGEYDPRDSRKFSGGDLAGLQRRLDYIRGIGATAVWITPPVANQWWNDKSQYGGYHGYWARDFKSVDAHFGSLEDYRRLADAMRVREMRLVQDIVVNHTADYFGYAEGVAPDPQRPQRGFVLRRQYDGATAPAQAPFDRNDARKAGDRAANIYHWTPGIRDFSVRAQELNWQLADLDDLNTENPVVRTALRDSYGFWIREVGVDGFRVDTAFYVPPKFFLDFLSADDPKHPGVLKVAADAGRNDFHVFGEGFAIDKPYRDEMARKIESYARTEDGRRLLPAMINFPLYGTLGDVFARGHAPSELAHRIERMMTVHADPWRMPTFVDNHDVDRFLAGGHEAGLKQALLAIMTLPGIPTIYYGTEQGLHEPRAAMFAAGYASGGRDRFDTTAPLYRYLQGTTALRREHRLFSRGTPRMLSASQAGPGAVAWRTDGEDSTALVVFNTADRATLLDGLETGLPAGSGLRPLFAIEGQAPTLQVDPDGRLDLVLPPRAGMVWLAERTTVGAGRTGTPIVSPSSSSSSAQLRTPTFSSSPGPVRNRDGRRSGQTEAGTGTPSISTTPLELGELSELRTPTFSGGPGHPGLSPYIDPTPEQIRGDFTLTGHAPGKGVLQLVIDGDLDGAQSVKPAPDGRWQALIRTDDMLDPAVSHRIVVWDPTTRRVSPAHVFRVDRVWSLLADVTDPAGDDHGPNGRYTYPDNPDWRGLRPADLLGARVFGSGGALKLELRMRELIAAWNPANGFDHVVFTLFIELPEQAGGVTAMPLQNAQLPTGMRWHLRLRAHGWSNALFDAEGAGPEREGRLAGEAARIEVDRTAADRTVTDPTVADRAGGVVRFTLPARVLGGRTSLSGLRLHVSTWDYDGGFRPLSPQAGANRFGGGETDDAKVMDALSITIE